jgi:hypothetical protein
MERKHQKNRPKGAERITPKNHRKNHQNNSVESSKTTERFDKNQPEAGIFLSIRTHFAN